MELKWGCIGTLAWACAAIGAQEALVSGQPLSVRANGGVGLLAAPRAIKSVPVGCAKVFGGKRPDLFVCAPTGVDRAFLLYRWVRDTPDGQPIFAPPVNVIQPFGDRNPPDGNIVQDAAGAVHGFWIKDRKLSHCLFDRDTLTFKQLASVELKGLPRPATAVTVLGMSGAGIDIVAACYNGAKYRPDGDAKSLDYVLYDGTGAFRGQWPRTGLYRCRLSADGSALTEPARLFSSSTNEILGGVTLATVAYPSRTAPHRASSPVRRSATSTRSTPTSSKRRPSAHFSARAESPSGTRPSAPLPSLIPMRRDSPRI